MRGEAAGRSPELSFRPIFDMLIGGKFPGRLRWEPNPGWDPPSRSEYWEEVWGWQETGIFIDDFELIAWERLDDRARQKAPFPPPAENRLLLFERTACEAVCEALRLAREEPAPQPAEAPRESELVRKARAWLDKTYPALPGEEGVKLRARVMAAMPGPGRYKKFIEEFGKSPGGRKIGVRDMRRALTGK